MTQSPGLRPTRPRRLIAPDGHLGAEASERQPKEAIVGQHALDDLGVVHPEVRETGVAKGTTRLVDEDRRPEPLHEPAQLTGRDGLAAQIDERDRHPPFLEEPEGVASRLGVLVAEDLDRRRSRAGHPRERRARVRAARDAYHRRVAEFPEPGAEITQILVVADIDRARSWYLDVLGAELHGEYGGTSMVLLFSGTWLLLVTGGEPTPDKPDVTFAPPAEPSRVAHANTIRVTDCRAVYDALLGRGAEFLTPPVESAWEIRAFFRDPDGHLFEISELRSDGPGRSDSGSASAGTSAVPSDR
jgi:catechol 2,3-dioxygenase-like lactoylglutathione lyase family enzyme